MTFLHDNICTNDQGHLTFAGLDTVALASKYGTPLMLLDENRIRARMRTYRDSLKKAMGESSFPCFASKALCMREIYRIAAEEGIGIDCVSAGEIITAASVGFPLSRAMFHGNNKTDADLEMALAHGIGYIVIDNLDEANALERLLSANDKTQNVLLRLTPGIDPHTNAKITTGQVDSKFGIAIETGQAIEAVKAILALPHLKLVGFHCHVGSQCFDSTSFLDAAGIMLAFMRSVKDRFGLEASILNLGGGYGVRYVEAHPEMDIEANITRVGEEIDLICRDLGLKKPCVVMEPGRSIVADAGMTLYTCGSVKTITGYKSYVSVDGGMPDNPRYALYQSLYTVINASNASETPDMTATIAGRCCESGDLLAEDVRIKTPMRGDIIAVCVTGAYNYAMASHYNRLPKPPIVMIKDQNDRLVVKRESYEDLMRNEL